MAKLEQPRRWLAAELVVVVLGVFIAMSIDAGREALQDRSRERELLEALRTEFKVNREQLSHQLDAYRARTTAAETLLELGPGVADLSPDSLNTLWQWVSRGGSFDPSSGVLQAAMGSGDIGLIRDIELRSALSQWPADVQDFHNIEKLVEDLIYEQLIPWVRVRSELPQMGFGVTDERGEFHIDRSSALLSETFHNFLREELAWWIILESTPPRESIERILQRLESALGR